jgi:bacillithiol biosynthesis cysteine-adding enzyme BshC
MHISSLPQFSQLYKDYVARFRESPVAQFFPVAPGSAADGPRWIDDRLSSAGREKNRATTAAAIARLHERLELTSDATRENLAQLAEPNAFAIVTGQQVGMLGGPLYTFFKAFTAIELAKRYSARFTDYRFVPIFWLETEDHDLEEAAALHVLDKDGALASITYAPAANTDPWRKQIGPLSLESDAVEQVFAQLRASLAHTEFTDALLAELQNIYSNGTTFADAFATLLFKYFGEEGLLIVDGRDTELKNAAKELIRKELQTSPQLSEKIVLRSSKLEDHYHAQVKPRALNLFLIENGERWPLVEHEPSPHAKGRTFFLKGTRRTFTLEELEQIIESAPERFSPNVVLRPLYQDTLLPTAAYVAGPGEIAYFAQFAPAYEWAGIPMPIVAPRLSATLVEERLERVLEKFTLSVEQILTEGRPLEEHLLSSLVDANLETAFDRATIEIENALEALRESVKETDPTLDASLTTLKGKVATTVRDFGNKVLAADRKKHSTARQQLDRLFAALLPNDELQERELSLIYFLNKYGPTFLDRLKSLLAPIVEENTEHHILHLATPDSASNAVPASKRELPTPAIG